MGGRAAPSPAPIGGGSGKGGPRPQGFLQHRPQPRLDLIVPAAAAAPPQQGHVDVEAGPLPPPWLRADGGRLRWRPRVHA